MIMDKQKFYKAVDMIDDDLIKEAEIAPDKLMESDGEGMTVSGVETYRRPKWSIIASVAAAAVLVLGVGTSLNMLMKHRPNVVQDMTDDTLEDSSGSDPAAEGTKESCILNESVTTALTTSPKSKYTHRADGAFIYETSTSVVTERTATETAQNSSVQQSTDALGTDPVVTTSRSTKRTTSMATAKTTTKATTGRTESVTSTTKSLSTEKIDVLTRLNGLTYSPDTCDGLPEFVLNAPADTEIFYFNFSEKWVWRNGSASNPVLKEAVLPDDLADYLMEHGEEIGMYPAQYSIPVPMQSYNFNAQYIRTDGYSGDAIYPRKKLITSRSELDSYIAANKDSYDFLHGFTDAVAKYDDIWFSSHKLLVVVLEEGSGSIRHTVAKVGGLVVTIQREIPEVGTCDMAEWHILIEVDKDLFVNSDFMVSTYDKYIR